MTTIFYALSAHIRDDNMRALLARRNCRRCRTIRLHRAVWGVRGCACIIFFASRVFFFSSCLACCTPFSACYHFLCVLGLCVPFLVILLKIALAFWSRKAAPDGFDFGFDSFSERIIMKSFVWPCDLWQLHQHTELMIISCAWDVPLYRYQQQQYRVCM